MHQVYQQFLSDIKETSWIEFIAVISGIASVWFSKLENIWVYPSGLINTIIYIFLSMKSHLFGEASVNLYYTIMSIYGWMLWLKKNEKQEYVLSITFASSKEWMQHLLFFSAFYVIIFFSLSYLKENFSAGTIPWADAFASATAYTGMWLMAKKKVESWYWWIGTNIASIPLYFVKHYVFTSIYYVILLALAFFGLISWMKKAKHATA
jgi:nicotinamide mononucleotide transporter